MPLGNPIRKQNESRMVSVLATEGQTVFTVQGGYIINHISVFRNGVRLSPADDFTAGDGSTVTLNDATNVNDRVDFHIFDRFTVQNAIIGAASTQTINGDLVINGKLFGQLDVPSISLTGIITATNLNVTGVSTFSDDVEFHGVNGISSITFDKSANNLLFKDGAKAAFGDSSDLIIFHDGTLSKIQNSSSGQLELVSNDIDLRSSTGDKNYFTAQVGGAATVFYDNSVRITTSPSGADVTGTLNVTGISTFQAVQGTTGTFSGQVNLNGDVNLGNASSDTVTVSGHVDSDIVPSGTTRDLGTSGTEWRNLYTANGVIASDDIAVHAGDSNTKIRFPAADTVSLETGGSERVRIDSSGRLLTGTTTASSAGNSQYSLFEVSGNTSGTTSAGHLSIKRGEAVASLSDGDTLGRLIFSGLDGGDFAYIQASVDAAPGSSDYPGRLMFWTGADGSGSPVERLRINSQGAIHINDGSASTARFEVGNGGDLKLFHTNPNSYIQDGSSALTISSARIDLTSPSGENMARLYQNAQVELYHNNIKMIETVSNGTRMPDGKFAEFGASADMQIGHNTYNYITYANSEFRLTGDSTNGIRLMPKSDETAALFNPNGSVQLYHNNGERLATFTEGVDIHVSGNAGLRVRGNAADVNPRLVFRRKQNDGGLAEPAAIQMTYQGGSTYESGHLDFLTNGDSGSAALSVKVRFQNDGVKYFDATFDTTANNARKSYFSGTGQLTMGRNAHEHYLIFQDVSNNQIGGIVRGASSQVAYNTTSDHRLKENVVNLTDAITRLKTLSPRRFNFISEPSITVDGFIAHEVTAVPEAVEGEKDAVVTQAMIDSGQVEQKSVGDPIYQGIDQSKLVPLLTAALQEAVAKIETLETKVAALEGS